MELLEDQVQDFIKDGKSIIRTWDEGCGYCTKYEPIFNEYVNESGIKAGVLRIHVLPKKTKPGEVKTSEQIAEEQKLKISAFKRKYMKQETSDQTREIVPGTFVFENGELKARHFGAMSKEELKALVEGYETPKPKEQPVQQKLYHLFAQKGEIVHNLEILQANLQRVNQEIINLQQPQKAV